jgi:hypothetical protein
MSTISPFLVLPSLLATRNAKVNPGPQDNSRRPYRIMEKLPAIIPGNEGKASGGGLLQGRLGRLDIAITHNHGEEGRAGVEEMRMLASESEPGKAGVPLAG